MKMQRNVVIALMLTIITSFTLQAAAYEEAVKMIVRIEQKDGKAIHVQLANLQKKRTKVSISDVNGREWFSEYAWGVYAYAKNLNLNGMPAGEYVLLIKNKEERHIQAFTKTKSNLFFFEQAGPQKGEGPTAIFTSGSSFPPADNVLISRFTADGAHGVDIQLANLLASKTVWQLKTMSGNTIYEEVIEGQNGYAKKVNLAGMTKGHYYILVRTGKLVRVQFLEVNSQSVKLKERQQLENGSLNEKMALK